MDLALNNPKQTNKPDSLKNFTEMAENDSLQTQLLQSFSDLDKTVHDICTMIQFIPHKIIQ